MKCSCCGGDADTVLETEASGVSFLCELCADGAFTLIVCQGAAEPCD